MTKQALPTVEATLQEIENLLALYSATITKEIVGPHYVLTLKDGRQYTGIQMGHSLASWLYFVESM